MTASLDGLVLDRLFREARSVHAFTDALITNDTLTALYDLLKWGPTAFNAQPARYVFVRSGTAKARLLPALSGSNKDKTLRAPVTVIVAYDRQFFDFLPEHNAKVLGLFTADATLAESTAFRNSSLQGAYLIIAARALGLAVGPMSGFNPGAIDAEFFPDGRYHVNFLVNMGYADDSALHARGPRLGFDEVAEII